MTETTIVFGASSYVGSTVTRKLLERGDRVIAVSRRPAIARILLPEQSESLSIAAAEDVAGLTGGEAVSIVNFAYVKDAPPHLLYRQNKALVTAIGEVAAAADCRRLIHISTSAVFGPRLETSPEPSQVRSAPVEDLYAESKVHAEHLIEGLRGSAGGELAILRLGNVIGPGSPIWVAGLAQRIMEVKPVGIRGGGRVLECDARRQHRGLHSPPARPAAGAASGLRRLSPPGRVLVAPMVGAARRAERRSRLWVDDGHA